MASPRLSIVLVVFREQGYIRDCLSSILDQAFGDIEVLAVDNASPDHGPEILDELAANDARLAVLHLESVISLGEAENLALKSVTGDYVWFVAATDRLPPGALRAVAARLEEAVPDVLVVDHTRSAVLGDARPRPPRALLRAAPATDSFTLEEYPAIVASGLEVRDKIFRRAFLFALGAPFAAGGYGHVPLTFPALLLAERISVLPRVCYERFDPPNAARAAHVHGTPFDVFGQYEAVFRFLDSQGGLASQRRLLVPQMLRHYLTVLAEVAPESRNDFFGRMSESYRRQAAGDEPIGKSRTLRLRVRLVARGNYRSFHALDRAVAAYRAFRRRLGRLRRLGGKAARVVGRQARSLYYRGQLRAPLEPHLAVFAAYWYSQYSCNPRAIYEKLRDLVPWVRAVWIVDRDHVGSIPADVEHVVAGTRDYYRVIARAKYLVNNVNFPNELVKREGSIHVQTHHGTPLKTMGLDQRDAFVAGAKRNFELQQRRVSRWDYSITSNAFSTLIWERAYPARYETLEVGYPRNDVFVNATDAEIDRIRDGLGIASGQRTVLFAPTHREYLPRYTSTVDIARLADALGEEYVIMVRVHYFYGGGLEFEQRAGTGRVLDVTGHPAVEDLCLAADVLVTDYSSIMFDYAVLDRPIVIHAPDWDVYRTLRGAYFDLLAEPPGVVTTTDDELVAAFRSGAVWSEHATRLRAEFRSRFCSLDDGRAAERVVRRIWLSAQEEAEEPLAAVSAPGTEIGA